MFKNLLNPDNALMITLSQITDCIFLSLFWLVGCIPVVTIGTSFAALYDATFRAFRKKEKHPWQRFLQVYKENWKISIVPTVLFLVAGSLLTKAMVGLWNSAVYGEISWMLFATGAFAGVLALGILSVLFPMLSRFENPTMVLVKNTVLLALANIPLTIALGFLNTVSLILCVWLVVPLFFLPSLACLIGSLFIEPMFKPYLPDSSEDAAE